MRLITPLLFALVLFSPRDQAAHSLYVSVGAEAAHVLLDGLEVGSTDSEGIFYTEPVSPGMHLLRIDKEGYRGVLDTIFVPAELTYNYSKPVEPLRVRLLNELTGLETDSVAGPYTLQIGAFREAENASRLAAGFTDPPARLETAEIPGLGVVHRVRLSLYDNLEAARAAASRIAQSRSLDIWIVGLDGRQWALQLAAFSVRAQAEKLAAAAAGPGLYIWIEEAPGPLFRVKAGYWPDRAAAQAAAEVKFSAGLGLAPQVLQVR